MSWAEANLPQGGKPTVCMLVPHFGNVTIEWCDTAYAPFKYIPHPRFNKTLKMARGIQNLDTERNMLVEFALQDPGVTHMFFLDTDCIPESPKDINQAVEILLGCNAPIVSGVYRAKKRTSFPYAMWMNNPKGKGYIPIARYDGNWLEVDVIGFGFVLVKREVFEKIPKPWFVWDRPQPSEDFAFCNKAKKAGFKINVMADVKVSHTGHLKVLNNGRVVNLAV
jgi:GT2 family glycosyltransferase